MNYKLLMDTAALTGEILLKSGAETYRVEDTMSRILKTSNIEQIETLALMTGIMATIDGEELSQPITVIKTVNERQTNLNNLIKVNSLSRNYCAGHMTLEEIYTQLVSVKEKQYSRAIFNVATATIATGFAIMLGGTLIDIVVATIVGWSLAGCMMLGRMSKMNGILQDILSCMVISFLAMLVQLKLLPELNMDIVIVSSLMPVVPGVAITNAIRDILQGDYLSGSARILEASLKAASIALGVGIGMAIGGVLL